MDSENGLSSDCFDVDDMNDLKATMDDTITDCIRSCHLCPRECGVNRLAGQKGYCGADARVIVARAALHFWEEPCISGTAGSGTVFFSGCGLGCVFCQNTEISGLHEMPEHNTSEPGRSAEKKLKGKEVNVNQLADIFLRLQDEQHASNINLVTATHYIPQTAAALQTAKDRGLRIPVVYNTGGYEKVSSLRMLDGLVDVYLPDFKYLTPALAKQYSRCEDYPARASEGLEEMLRQTGKPVFYIAETGQRVSYDSGDADSTVLIKKGVIVRHLLLPGHVEEAKRVVRYLHDTYGNDIYISLMNQYTPMKAMSGDPLLGRKVTRREYGKLVDYSIEIGVENGFIQEGNTAKESFIPSWNGEGV